MNYEKLADFLVNGGGCCICGMCNLIDKCFDCDEIDEKNCVTGVADYLKEKFSGDEYTYIPATEIARYLNKEATDEQFAEVFALLHRAMFGRNLSNVYNTKQIIKQMNVDALMQCLGRTLKEIQNSLE